ncbi:uncharacterized protein LOC133799944 [Humulus lupulus]|uniref:uncharacterized protein LOC133799944 n=1 Tax=Humulus lupulus TaxID=3486 RepID=UPI002B4033FF|nr:uncharacterized protein LOC133799944 [Humulus lupulus]
MGLLYEFYDHRYLLQEKKRGKALDSVANFHLQNGEVYMSSEDDTQEMLFRLRQYLESSSASRSSRTIIDNLLFQRLAPQVNPVKVPLPSDNESDSDDSVRSYRTMAQQRTLKELAALNLDQQPLCIQYPSLDVNFEMKSGLIHLLPSFHGLPGEDLNKHLQEFRIVYSSMEPTVVTKEQIKLRAFPFSLKDTAKEWLYYLPPGTVETWNGMKTLFLEQHFPASKVSSGKRSVISEQLLIQYFYEGLQSLDRSMIDAASGGALVDKTPAAARSLISPMVQQLALGQQVRPCGICQVVGHATDTCPTLFEGETESVNAVGNFPGQLRQMYYEPFSQTYNLGWHDHPNLRYGNQQQVAPQSTSSRPPGFTLQQRSQNNFVPRPSQASQAAPPPSAKPSTEDLINALAINTLQFQQTTQASIKSLENQVGQLATSYNRLEAHLSNKLPSLPEMNPKENASAVTLRSGTQYDLPSPPMPSKLSSKPQVDCSVNEDFPPKPTTPTQLNPKPTFVIPPPFLSRLKKIKKEEVDKEILDTFRKVEVNIPLLDVIKQVSRYAKFLKELCTNKRKLRASINVMSLSIYASLNLGPLKETGVIIQLADRSNTYPKGVIEDVLVQVNEDESIPCSTPIFLGRPFMKTARTKIDVHDGTLTMEFDGETIRFNIFEAMSEFCLEVALRKHLVLTDEDFSHEIMDVITTFNSGFDKTFKNVAFLNLLISSEKLQPSIVQAPTLELKPLP